MDLRSIFFVLFGPINGNFLTIENSLAYMCYTTRGNGISGGICRSTAQIVMASNHCDLSALEAEVASARSSTISSKSRACYLSSTVRFLQWMIQHKRSLMTEEFIALVTFNDAGHVISTSITTALSSAPLHPPLRFQQIAARDFMMWIMSMKRDNGSFSFFCVVCRTPVRFFFNLLRDNHHVMPIELERELSCHFKGLQHQIASAIGSGDGPIKIGKDPIPFSFYRQVAMEMLRSTSSDMIFSRAFMIMSWNLMSRASNTASICYNHVEWGEDALRVFFAHMKNDQRGARPPICGMCMPIQLFPKFAPC